MFGAVRRRAADARWLSEGEDRASRGYRRMRTLLDLQIGRDLAGDSGLADSDYDVLPPPSRTSGAGPGGRRSARRSRVTPVSRAGRRLLNALLVTGMCGESACRRGSVHRARMSGPGWVAIHLCGPPGDVGRVTRPTFGLAPGGVCRAARVAPGAGALLPHRFTLACARSRMPSAVCSLWHFPAGRPDWPLASTLPYGAPTFLGEHAQRTPSPRPPGRLAVTAKIVARDDHP